MWCVWMKRVGESNQVNGTGLCPRVNQRTNSHESARENFLQHVFMQGTRKKWVPRYESTANLQATWKWFPPMKIFMQGTPKDWVPQKRVLTQPPDWDNDQNRDLIKPKSLGDGKRNCSFWDQKTKVTHHETAVTRVEHPSEGLGEAVRWIWHHHHHRKCHQFLSLAPPARLPQFPPPPQIQGELPRPHQLRQMPIPLVWQLLLRHWSCHPNWVQHDQ